MTYKSTQVYVMMRESWNSNPEDAADPHNFHPVAVFTELETAEGNAEGYNLSMQEDGIDNVKFYVTTTMMYE